MNLEKKFRKESTNVEVVDVEVVAIQQEKGTRIVRGIKSRTTILVWPEASGFFVILHNRDDHKNN